jgi:glycosyltransferase involved in cell wall biosynthesis
LRTGLRRWRYFVIIFLPIAVLGGLQFWSTCSTQQIVNEAVREAASIDRYDLALEKTRQDLIGQRIANYSRGNFETNLATGLGTLSAILISIVGAVLVYFGHLNEHQKARSEAKARAKDRQDRLAATLSETLSRLVSEEPRERVVGAAGLLPFFGPDRKGYHLQALATLIAAARIKGDPPEMRQTVRLAVEHAVRGVKHDFLVQVSWQGVQLPSINLIGLDLRGWDLRDAMLENAKLTGANLDGATLEAADLRGAQLQEATLVGANLTHADLAGASLAGATLKGAQIDSIKVLNLDLRGTDFKGLKSGWRGVPWDVTANWRKAHFDDDARAELEAKYGSEAPSARVFMLMWEISPIVAGGTWTACYHLVRNLRQRGADLTIVVPWDQSAIWQNAFGIDVPIVALGMVPPPGSVDGLGMVWSSYSRQGAQSETILHRLLDEFQRLLEIYVRDNPPDLIHAHEWVTFGAAKTAASVAGVPWIAHFHSVEADRQLPGIEDKLTREIENDAVKNATTIIVPSDVTKRRLKLAYNADAGRINVVPNALSEGVSSSETGSFETKRVIFVGRLSGQKGLERFGEVAKRVHAAGVGSTFEVYGVGENLTVIPQYPITWKGALRWVDRGNAYRAASVLLVPSRSEPFGMVILEAMQHCVPVIYPNDAGAAEVLQSGVKISAADVDAMTAQVVRLLGSRSAWEETVRAQTREIESYANQSYERFVITTWQQVREQ